MSLVNKICNSKLFCFVSVSLLLIVLAGLHSAGYIFITGLAPLGTPDSCGETITTDLLFDKDLDCSGVDSDGIIIGADDITIDCGGFSIIGKEGSTTRDGINLTLNDNVTIQNCNIREFNHGIYISSSNNTLLNINSSYNRYGIRFWISYLEDYPLMNNTLTNINLHHNADNGLWLLSVVNSTFTNINSSYNKRGILTQGRSGYPPTYNTFENITTSYNDLSGIWMSYSQYCTINNLNSNYNEGAELAGLILSSGDPKNNIFTNINTSYNAGHGVALFIRSTFNTFESITSSYNAQQGILLDFASNENIFLNTSLFNNLHGVFVSRTSNSTFLDTFSTNNSEWDFISTGTTTNNRFFDFNIGKAKINFTYEGEIALKSTTPLETTPEGYSSLPPILEIVNNSAGSRVYVNISYVPGWVYPLNSLEEDLRIWKHNGTNWVETNESWVSQQGVNTEGDYVYAEIIDFSTFTPLIYGGYLQPHPAPTGFVFSYDTTTCDTIYLNWDIVGSATFYLNEEGRASWTETTSSSNWENRRAHTSFSYDNKMWVLGGVGSQSYNDVWYSTDGESWVNSTNDAEWTKRYAHTSVIFDNKMWVIGGFNGSYINDVWYSTDGETWTNVSNADWNGRYGHTSVDFSGKIWVLGGSNSSNEYLNDVWYSTDGETWIEVTNDSGWSKRRFHTSVIFDNKMWVIGGFNGTDRLNDVWYSEDGENWTKTFLPSWIARSHHSSIVYHDLMMVFGGYDGSNGLNDVWYTKNGETWTQFESAEWTGRYAFPSLLFSDKIYIFGGHDGLDQSDIWSIKIPLYSGENSYYDDIDRIGGIKYNYTLYYNKDGVDSEKAYVSGTIPIDCGEVEPKEPEPTVSSPPSGIVSRPIYSTYYWEEQIFEQNLKATDKVIFEFENQNHTITILTVQPTYSRLWLESEKLTLEIPIGETKYVDLNSDGKDNILLSLEGVEGSIGYFAFERIIEEEVIVPEAPVEPPVEPPVDEKVEEPISTDIEELEEEGNLFAIITTAITIIVSLGIFLYWYVYKRNPFFPRF